MSKNNYTFLTGPDLLSLLSVADRPIKWIDPSGSVLGHLEPERAVLIVKSGNFTGKCSPKRVLYIKEVETRKIQVDYSYWDGRACGLYRWPNTPVTSQSIRRWDRIQSSRLELSPA